MYFTKAKHLDSWKYIIKWTDKHTHKGFLGCSVNYYLHFCQYECALFVWFCTGCLHQTSDWDFTETPEGRQVNLEPWKNALVTLCSAPSLTLGIWPELQRWRKTPPALRRIPLPMAPQGQTFAPTTSSTCGLSQTAAARNMRMETGN